MEQSYLADTVLIVHFGWIIFMVYGFVLTVRAFWRPAFWDRWIFRTVHLAGILLVAGLEILGKYCPLTVWEDALRRTSQAEGEVPSQFIMGYIEKLVYPGVSPLVYLIPTYGIALFTLLISLVKPPKKFQHKSKRR